MSENDFKSLSLSSSFDEISRLKPYIDYLQAQLHFDGNAHGNIRLAVNEAVNNAIKHGNKQDPSKNVHIAASLQDDMLQISVEDEGTGYELDSIPDPRKEENLLNMSGRGLFLMNQYTSKLAFENSGSKVIMYFLLDD